MDEQAELATQAWRGDDSARCEALIDGLVAEDTPPAERDRLWGELFRVVAPHLERWCYQSTILRRAGLGSEDDWRATLLRVVERLVERRFANLRAYREHRQKHDDAGTLGASPFEGWLRRLVKFAAADEVQRCLSVRRVRPTGGSQTVEGMARESSSRTGMTMTSALWLRQRQLAVRQALQGLDEDQKAALLWRVRGKSYDEIALALGLGCAEATALVRAAKARLRRNLRQTRLGVREP